jgi:hypothetical protein
MGTFAGKRSGNALRRIRYIATKLPGASKQVSNLLVDKREKSQTEHSTEAERVLPEQRMFHERDAGLPGVNIVNTWHAQPEYQS